MEVTPYIYYIYDARRKEYGFQREMKGSKKRTIYEFCRTRGIGAAKPLELVLLVSETLRTDYLNGTRYGDGASMYRTPDSP
jgi:hypothetical protein